MSFGQPEHPISGRAMVTKKIIKGSLQNKKKCLHRQTQCSLDITKQGNPKDHDQDEQKHVTKGKRNIKGKVKGKDNMEDNKLKHFPEKDPMVGLRFKKGSFFCDQVGQHGCVGEAQEAGQV
jgi:hypothetical protein